MPVLLVALAVLTGCTALQKNALPPVPAPPGANLNSGQLIWVDLITEDIAAAAAFYGRFFGWRAARSNQNEAYYLFFDDNGPVAGMVATDDRDVQAVESLWLLTMAVEDVDRAVAVTKANGGKLLDGPVDVEGRGRTALIGDAGAAPLILLAAAGGPRPNGAARAGQWLWSDLVTADRQRAKAFYGVLADLRAEPVETGAGHRYEMLKRNDRPLAGIVELQWDGLEDNWLPYFKVTDVDQAIEEAGRMGGQLILRSGDAAVLADPTGAAFGIQTR